MTRKKALRRGAAASAGVIAILAASCTPSTPEEIPHHDLVQAERAFGDRAGDLPPTTCEQLQDSRSAQECRQKRIMRMHVEDLDGDGWADVQLLHVDRTVSTYHNRQGTFAAEEGTAWRGGGAAEGTSGPEPVSILADLNGDGWEERIDGRSSPDPHQIMTPPAIFDGRSGARIHLLDLERRRIIGASELVWAGDLTGDLVPDLLIAGHGMTIPHLYVNTSPAGGWAQIRSSRTVDILYPTSGRTIRVEPSRDQGAVTWRNLGVSVGLVGAERIRVSSSEGGGATLEAGRIVQLANGS